MRDYKTITFNSLPPDMESGMTLETYSLDGKRKGKYVIKSVTGETVAHVRTVRWYDWFLRLPKRFASWFFWKRLAVEVAAIDAWDWLIDKVKR